MKLTKCPSLPSLPALTVLNSASGCGRMRACIAAAGQGPSGPKDSSCAPANAAKDGCRCLCWGPRFSFLVACGAHLSLETGCADTSADSTAAPSGPVARECTPIPPSSPMHDSPVQPRHGVTDAGRPHHPPHLSHPPTAATTYPTRTHTHTRAHNHRHHHHHHHCLPHANTHTHTPPPFRCTPPAARTGARRQTGNGNFLSWLDAPGPAAHPPPPRPRRASCGVPMRADGATEVRAGQYVSVRPDYVMTHDK